MAKKGKEPVRESGIADDSARDSRLHRRLASKAAEIAESVLPYFEKERPDDDRPRQAIHAIRAWAIGDKRMGMQEVRRLALGAHAAARSCGGDAARYAARAAGQAVAVWHAPMHALAVPDYACKARLAAQPAHPSGKRRVGRKR